MLLIQVKKTVRQMRAARTVAVIIGAFIVCWIPYTADCFPSLQPNHSIDMHIGVQVNRCVDGRLDSLHGSLIVFLSFKPYAEYRGEHTEQVIVLM